MSWCIWRSWSFLVLAFRNVSLNYRQWFKDLPFKSNKVFCYNYVISCDSKWTLTVIFSYIWIVCYVLLTTWFLHWVGLNFIILHFDWRNNFLVQTHRLINLDMYLRVMLPSTSNLQVQDDCLLSLNQKTRHFRHLHFSTALLSYPLDPSKNIIFVNFIWLTTLISIYRKRHTRIVTFSIG